MARKGGLDGTSGVVCNFCCNWLGSSLRAKIWQNSGECDDGRSGDRMMGVVEGNGGCFLMVIASGMEKEGKKSQK